MRKRRPRTTDRFPKWTEEATPPALLASNGQRRAYAFPEAPPVGTCIVSRNHGHQLVEVLTDDGHTILRWRTICGVCHEPFLQDLGLAPGFMNARCPSCRSTGPRAAANRRIAEDDLRDRLTALAASGPFRIRDALVALELPKSATAAVKDAVDRLVEDCLLVEGDADGVYESA